MKVHQATQVHRSGERIVLTMKSMSCFRCCRDDVNEQCTHHILGEVKYPSSRRQEEVISCEPVLSQHFLEQLEIQENLEQLDTVDNLKQFETLDNLKQLETKDDIEIKQGDSLLVKIEHKNHEYRYVSLVLSVENEGNEFKVQGLKHINDENKQFVVRDNDIFLISRKEVVRRLPSPGIVMKGRLMTYIFSEPVEVFEKN